MKPEKTFLVTGVNRGIGLSLSKKILKNGMCLIGVCRTQEKCEIFQRVF